MWHLKSSPGRNLAGPLVWAVQLSLTHKYLSVGMSTRLKHTKSFMSAFDFKWLHVQVIEHLGDTPESSEAVIITDIVSSLSLPLLECCDLSL